MGKLLLLLISVAGTMDLATAETRLAFSHEQICKAAIGKVMGRDPISMIVSGSEGGTIYLHYIRKNDQSKWAYRCKLEGNRVVWATDTGRWRTDLREEKIFYRISGDALEIVEQSPDGSSSKELFKASQFGHPR